MILAGFKIKAWKISFLTSYPFFKSLTILCKIVESGLDPRLRLLTLEYSPLTRRLVISSREAAIFHNGINARTNAEIRILSNTQYLRYSYLRGMCYFLRSHIKDSCFVVHLRFQTP